MKLNCKSLAIGLRCKAIVRLSSELLALSLPLQVTSYIAVNHYSQRFFYSNIFVIIKYYYLYNGSKSLRWREIIIYLKH